ncbi:hypothetical protein LXL04_022616 [Taraxacum kok-saghyz]
MEISPTLATESISFSWLINNRASFKQETKCFLEESTTDFTFGVLSSTSTTADEMFSAGYVLPKHLIASNLPPLKATGIYNTENIRSHNIFSEWKKSSKRMMKKLFASLRSRKGRRVNDSSNSTCQKSMVPYSHSMGVSYELKSSISDAVLYCKKSNGN